MWVKKMFESYSHCPRSNGPSNSVFTSVVIQLYFLIITIIFIFITLYFYCIKLIIKNKNKKL